MGLGRRRGCSLSVLMMEVGVKAAAVVVLLMLRRGRLREGGSRVPGERIGKRQLCLPLILVVSWCDLRHWAPKRNEAGIPCRSCERDEFRQWSDSCLTAWQKKIRDTGKTSGLLHPTKVEFRI